MIQEMYIAVSKNNPNEYHSFVWTQDDKLIVNGQEASLQDWDIICMTTPIPQDPTHIPYKSDKEPTPLAIDWLIQLLPQIDWDDPYYRGIWQEAKNMEITKRMESYSEGYDEGLYDGMYK